MRTQIVSLQRTGSKALHTALYSQLKNPLKVGGGPLGEFLHGWEEFGYKFGEAAMYPFDPQAEVFFHTNPKFKEVEGKNFRPVSYTDEGMRWINTTYGAPISYDHLVLSRLGLLREYSDRDMLVKTQLAYLAEDLSWNYKNEIVKSILSFFDLNIAIVPTDIKKWIFSNLLGDHTGVFVACPDMKKAASRLQEAPIVIQESEVNKLMARLQRHLDLAEKCHVRINTDSLCDFGIALGLSIPHIPEFSAYKPEELIANYAAVSAHIDQLWPSINR